MKKMNLILCAFAMFAFVSLSACNTAPAPQETETEEVVNEDANMDAAADTVEVMDADTVVVQ